MSIHIVTDIYWTQMVEPTSVFFLDPPPNAAARFTVARSGEKADLLQSLPKRQLVFWEGAQLRQATATFRYLYPRIAKAVTRPRTWSDLYCWFDHDDLWHYGATNVWNLLDRLADENDYLMQRRQNALREWFDDGIFINGNLYRLLEFENDAIAVDALLFARYGSVSAVEDLPEDEITFFKDTLLPRVTSIRAAADDLNSIVGPMRSRRATLRICCT